MVALSICGEAKSAGSNDGTWLQGHVMANGAFFTDSHVGMELAMHANGLAGSNWDEGVEPGVISDDCILINDDVRADLDVGAEFRRSVDDRRGMDLRKDSIRSYLVYIADSGFDVKNFIYSI